MTKKSKTADFHTVANRAEVEDQFRRYFAAAKASDQSKSNIAKAIDALKDLEITVEDISDGGMYLALAQSVCADVIVGEPGKKARTAFDDPKVVQARNGKDTVKGKQKKAVNTMVRRLRLKLMPPIDMTLIEEHLKTITGKITFLENAIKADSKAREDKLAQLGGEAAAKKMLAAWDKLKSAYPKK